MNQTLPQQATDELDRLLTDFFKSQLRQPWPNAPVPSATDAAPAIEPSVLAVARAADAPRNVPRAPATAGDTGARARFTLAASVALLLGTGWFLADGFQPGSPARRSDPSAPQGLKFLPGGDANGNNHAPLKKIGEDKAKGDNGGIKIDVGGIE